MLSYKFIRLTLKFLINIDFICVCLPHNFIHGRERPVVVYVLTQKEIWRYDLIKHFQLFVLFKKLFTPLFVPEIANQVIYILVIKIVLNKSKIVRRLTLHLVFEKRFQESKVLDNGVYFIAVKGKGFFQFLKDTYKIQDKSMRLYHLPFFVFIRAIDAGDGLQEGMVTHRFIQIHGIEDRGVKAGEKLFCDDKDLRELTIFSKRLTNLPLFLIFKMEFLQQRRVIVISGIDNLRVFRLEVFIQRLLVEGTCLAVNTHEKSLISQRFHILLVMPCYKLRNIFNT